jgi:CheY-like chemotaxis protein/phosphoribosyl 1,2-cyclic phosphodiesterase
MARPGPSTLLYGGNTSCVEVRCDDGTLIVLDCGTGAWGLGRALLAAAEGPVRGHLFLTHTHWDHIQGFPFFGPLFVAGNEWDVYGPGGAGSQLEATLAGQMEYEYFPISLGQLGATIRIHDLDEGTYQIGGAQVTARYMNHPGVTLGYRIEAGGQVVVYVADHEPHSRHQPDAMLGARMAAAGAGVQLSGPVHREDRQHIEFLRNAGLAIHDAQYTAEEYPAKMGWGHTPAETAVEFAVAAGVKRLALFHHDPARGDTELATLEHACQAHAADAGGIGGSLEVFAAMEGMLVELEERAVVVAARGTEGGRGDRSLAALGMTGEGQESGRVAVKTQDIVLIVDDDDQIVRLLKRALQSEQLRLISASDAETALRLVRRDRPDLVLLDWRMPGRDGLDVCRAIRAERDPQLRNIPVVLLTAETASEDTAAAFDAGVTDYLTKPFGVAHVRARVHEWLMRGHSAVEEPGEGVTLEGRRSA